MESLIIILIGFTAVAIYDALCSILSKRLNVEYVWFAFGSFIIYGIFTIFITKATNLYLGLVSAFMIGVFDTTIGLLIAKKLKANIKKEDLEDLKITPSLILYMGFLAVIIGAIALYFFS
ncbi:hypothetical protein [uncultured Tenacibaculum sp.]|uniref:hypothetical protein n=1 Tax=uncultured Tenacibaculum sp. TaxID=174713 RepID=UPI00262E3A35|nr:hypothetical protein [uncultured Tenacibaculum sp.]